MEIRLYKQVVKKNNSTYRPSSTPVSKDVRLKENTSILNPTFLLSSFDASYNYMYVPKWNRYYFVSDVNLNIDGVFELSCSCDRGATFKDEIGSYTAFVERCSNVSGINTDVQDNAITSEETVSEIVSASTSLWTGGGVVICRTININHGITTYAGSWDSFKDLFNPNIDPQSITDFLQGLLEFFLCNPGEYVLDCYFLPVGIGEFSAHGSPDLVSSGWYTGTGGAFRWTSAVPIISGSKSLSKPSAKYSDWRESNGAFTKYLLYVPACGEVELSADIISKSLVLEYYIDINTGEVAYFLKADNDVIATYNGNFKSALQTGSMAPSGGGLLSSGATALTGVLSGNPIAIGNALITATQNIITPSPSINGSMGSCAGVIGHSSAIITRMSKDSCDSPVTLGKPCCKNIQISTIPGYIKTVGASVNIAGYDSDKDAVNNLLDGGFYYE